MKITVEISDALLRDAKRIAAREGITVRSLIEQGLRRAVAERRRSGEFRLRRATFKGEGLTPEASRLAGTGCANSLMKAVVRDRGRHERSHTQVDAWFESPTLVTLAESEDYWPRLRGLLAAGKVAGPKVHDARIAALCAQHGVRALWSADRDFGLFPDLTVANPLVG